MTNSKPRWCVISSRSYKYIFPLYLLTILLLITLPLNDTNLVLTNNYILQIRLDYLAHVALFLPYIFLFRLNWPKLRLAAFLTGLCLALGTECLQYFLSYRSFNINDLVGNGVGIILGALFLIPGVFNKLLSDNR